MPRAAARVLSPTAVAALAIAVFAAAPAAGDIYWANEGADTISRAENDGTGISSDFISGTDVASNAHGVAVDATYIYWAHDGVAGDAPAGNIGRAPLDESDPPTANFISTTNSPKGVVLDQAGISWTQATPGTGAIGRANLSATFVNQSHVSNIGASPCGLTTDFDKFFWALSGSPGLIRRSHGSFPPFADFSPSGTTSDPCGVALASGIVYWTNLGDETIGRADLSGASLGTPIDVGADGDDPCGIAVDETHIYWTERGTDTIDRSDLDGNPIEGDAFPIDAGSGADPCGIAVDPTAAAEPSLTTFAATAIGGRSDTATLVLRNTSSSVLDPTAATVVGANPDDFKLVGDGCSVNVVSIGQVCVLNVDFTPTGAGSREAILRVQSNASDSPTEFALAGEGTPPVLPEPPPAPPVEPPKFARSLSISYSRRQDRFKGALASDSTACAEDQKVAVFKRRRGDDLKVGSDRTDAAGRWRLTKENAAGRFYGSAKETALADGGTCLEARSKTLNTG